MNRWTKTIFFFLLVFCMGTSSAHASLASDAEWRLNTSLQAWQAYSSPDGSFVDPMQTSLPEGYGLSLLGYDFVRQGLRTGRQDWIDRGIVALSKSVALGNTTPFDTLALPSAYKLLEETQASNPVWQTYRPVWDNFFQTWAWHRPAGNSTCLFKVGCYNNWYLIAASGDANLMGLGKISSIPGTFFSPEGQAAAAGRINNTLNSLAPKNVESTIQTLYGPASLLSDPEDDPLAYALFSSIHLNQLYAKYPGMFGPGARDLPAQTSRYVLSYTGPDGDASWMGRSSQQSWTLAGGFLLGLQAAENDPTNAVSYLGMARISMQKLLSRPDFRGTIPLTPSVVQSAGSYKGLDNYASSRAYNGLTLLFMSQGLEILQRHPDWNLDAAVEGGLSQNFGRGVWIDEKAGLSWMQGSKIWVALNASGKFQQDARYSDGILSIKTRKGSQWNDAFAGMPRSNLQVGLGMKKGSKTGRLVIKKLRSYGDEVRGRAVFVTSSGRVLAKTPISFFLQGSKLVVEINAKKGQTLVWSLPAKDGKVKQTAIYSKDLKVRFDQKGKKAKSGDIATALSAKAKMLTWQGKIRQNDTFQVTLSAK